ncbi:MAG: filamentous hemagglutinin family protein [Hydrogenophilales bacterium]|nr:filamentous hemagglutinin family protein [Hydrogenophilales bacterium]
MQINQTAAKTTIRWNSFDIGQGYTVRFNQPSASAEAMNYIGGANPSVIQGTLSANGKVYLVNANGILFDGTAQVNVNTLIASSLDIAQSTFDNGITSNLSKKDPTLVATMVLNTAGQVINYGTIRSVKVDGPTGQVVADPKTGKPVEEGGVIMLFAPQVENHGLITANNGQVILAAGGTVYLQLYNDPTGDPNDLSMRGFLVKVTAAPNGSLNLSQLIAAQKLNSAANLGGEIHTDRGNTTLTGLVVNQSGLVSANTAATVNGSIWLKAENYDDASKQTTYGTLTTSKDSVTQVLPEDDGTTLAESDSYTDNSLYNNGNFPHYQGMIKLLGETVVHDGQAVAPGGRIVVGKEYVNNDNASRPAQTGRVYLGADSVLSVAGLWVDLPYSDNYLSVKLQSVDLANSPLQKGGFLIGKTVTVDPRKGTPKLFDIADKLAGMLRSVREKATTGGTITVNTGEFISSVGSKVDVSGGGYRYGDGMATTTYLTSHGRLYDIATAPANLQYDDRVVTITTPVRGYVEGKSAGLLAIDAQQMILGGNFAAGVTTGPYQRAPGAMPTPGKLVLGTQSIQSGGTPDFFASVKNGTTANSLDTYGSPYALQDVVFGDGTAIRQKFANELADLNADPVNAAFPVALKDKLLLPTDLFGGTAYGNAQASASQGFGTLAVRASGSITVPQDVTLDLGTAGSLFWLAPQIEVDGTVKAQGGSLVFNRYFDNSLYGATHLGTSGVLSVAGGWINDAFGVNGAISVPNVIDGGSVAIAGYGTLDQGSRVDASGGAMLGSTGKLSYGNGGAITLPTIGLNGVTLQAYGGSKGGSLTLNADTIDVGGSSGSALSPGFFTQGGFTDYSLAGIYQVNFKQDIHPVAYQRIAKADAQLSPTGTPFGAISSVLSNAPDYLRTAASLSATTGASISTTFQLGANETGIVLDPGVSIVTDPLAHINLTSHTRMDIEGALVAPGGVINLSLDPGDKFYYDVPNGAFNALNIGSQALISTAGVYLPSVGPRGLITGQVLSGGSVSLAANKNDLDVAQGAVIDVSGTSHLLDLQTGSGYTRADVASEGGRVTIEATENAYLDGTFKGKGGDASVAGGSFQLDALYNGRFGLVAYGSVLQAEGDANAAAAMAFMDPSARQLQHVILLSQTDAPLAHDGSSADTSRIGNLFDANHDYVAPLRANISADQLINGVERNGVRAGGGFDRVVLNSDNQIQIGADVNNFAPRALLRLDTPELRALGNSSVTPIQVGEGSLASSTWETAQLQWYNTPSSYRLSGVLSRSLVDEYSLSTNDTGIQVPVATQKGNATLSLSARQIALAGNVTANGTAQLDLISAGDLRFEGFPVTYTAQNDSSDKKPLIANLQALNGGLYSAGNIGLQAGQIYPATAVNYTVAVGTVALDQLSQSVDSTGAVTLTATVSRAPVIGGLLNIKANESADSSPVFSAGGTLTLQADSIDQSGILRAPLGTINLKGGHSLTLEGNSVTSVSAIWAHDGVETDLTIPYGATQSVGQSLWYGSVQTTAPPSKAIEASADAVTVASGATLDLRGGGDFAAMEFIPGIGGTKDVLAAPGTYAIVPGVAFQTSDSYLNSLAPVSVNAAAAYNMVHLGAGSGLPEGDYALLPAYYALLPGAYLVKAQSGAAYAPGFAATQPDGSVVVAGKLGYAGTGIRQSTWSGFSIQSGADALTGQHAQGEYRLTGGQFFPDQAARNNTAAPALPRDGGRLSIGATGSLAFEGNLLAQAAEDSATGKYGAIGQVDIYGSKFAIVDHTAVAPSGYTRLQADELSRLGASLLIGGKRTDTTSGQSLDVVASDVLVDLDGGTLSLPELWLAATDNLTVTGASTLDASGTAVGRAGTLTVNTNQDGKQYGALLGLSSAELAPIARVGAPDADPAHGNLNIDAGAKLSAKGGAIAIDSTGTPVMAGVTESDSLAIGARQIALGAVPQGSTALALGNAQLAALGSARNFVLRSYSSIDLYGNVSLGQTGTGSFTFDSAGLVGHDVNGASAPVALSAGTITLENLSGSALAANAPGTGTLTLNADKLVLADSNKNGAGFTVAGFNQVNVDAGEVSLQGSGTLRVASDLNIAAGRIAAGGRLADQQIQAYDAGQQTWHAIRVTQPASAAAFADAPLPGGKLKIDGSSVDFGGNVVLQSGRLALAAHGTAASDGVTLENGSSIDLSAYEKTFAQGTANLTESASAGRLTLTSDSGAIDAKTGSSIDLQGGSAGGDAGVLTVAAANGTVALDGTLSAGAAPGQQAGSADIDAANLANFSALNTALETGGFGQSRTLRARTGDVNVAATDSVNAKNIQLVADAGSINVKGSLDASGAAGGGQVELDAGQGMHLYSGSRIAANGTSTDTTADAAYSGGGKVALYARNGQLDFDSGAAIDVSAAAAGKSSGGEVVFSAPRTANGSGLQAALAGQLKVAGGTVSVPGGQAPRDGTVILEGYKRYSDSEITTTTTSAAASTTGVVYTDYDTFMNAADGIHDVALLTLLAGGSDIASGNLKVRAGVELVSRGDMTVDANWDLTNASWLRTGANQTAGRLALRAAGDLVINARLGLPNDTSVPTKSGWSLQLAGGADVLSADPMAVLPLSSLAASGKGDVAISDGVKVTSSTGAIQIAAGRDFIEGSGTAIYTTGQAVTLPTFMRSVGLKTAVPFSGVNLIGGGDITITAGRNVSGTNDYAAPNVWLRRAGVANTDSYGFYYLPAYWWVDRAGNSGAGTVGIQGISTLGGGNIDIAAGSDVRGLSVVSASSRSAATTATAVPMIDSNGNLVNQTPSANAVYGGGDIRIDAGRDVLAGQYLVSRGDAALSAGGRIGGLAGASDTGTAPAFWLMGWSDDPALQGAHVWAQALGDATISTVANPTVMEVVQPQNYATASTKTPGYQQFPGYFFSYAANDSMDAVSVGGNLTLAGPQAGTPVANAGQVLPPRFAAGALLGSVSSGSQFDAARVQVGLGGIGGVYQYPDRNGRFLVLAGDAVHDMVLNASDYTPSALATAADQVLAGHDYFKAGLDHYTFTSPVSTDARMADNSTLGGYRYAVVAGDGSVSNAAFYFPQHSVVAAGTDIANVLLDLQNLGSGDISQIAAGRDVLYSNVLSNGTQWGNMPHVQIAGPGSLLVEAGRDVNLGAVSTTQLDGDRSKRSISDLENVTRIDAIGNTGNASLPTADAATLIVMSGVDTGSLGEAQVNSLFTVLRSVGQFQGLLGEVRGNTMSDATAIADANAVIDTANAAIGALFAGPVQAGSLPVYLTPIDANGKTAKTQIADAYNGALAAANNAIAALFQDGRQHQGDITLYNARISSSTNPGGSGGDINLLAPHGDIKVGLPTASSERNIGIYTTAGGAINAYLSGDMNVNLSKVATFQGGDILLYTSGAGSTLDAGRGSRSARTSSPPRLVAELKADGTPTGKLLLLPPLDVGGSGIRTVSYDPDGFGPLQQPEPGKVYLLAPTGTIDAGEAGVSSASGLVVAALTVKNADNFSASGSSVGVPAVSSGAPAAPVSGDAAASASKAMDAVSQAGSALAKNDTDLKSFRPAFITVEVLGFGNDAAGCGKDDDACRKQKSGGT